jgi:hypothetical protein
MFLELSLREENYNGMKMGVREAGCEPGRRMEPVQICIFLIFIYLFIYCKFTIYSIVYNKSNKKMV